MAEPEIEVPAHAGSREQAAAMVTQLPLDLHGQTVVLDCKNLAISTPSFFDEMVKLVLLQRKAKQLELINANERARTHAERAAANRGVSERLEVALRI